MLPRVHELAREGTRGGALELLHPTEKKVEALLRSRVPCAGPRGRSSPDRPTCALRQTDSHKVPRRLKGAGHRRLRPPGDSSRTKTCAALRGERNYVWETRVPPPGAEALAATCDLFFFLCRAESRLFLLISFFFLKQLRKSASIRRNPPRVEPSRSSRVTKVRVAARPGGEHSPGAEKKRRKPVAGH